VEVPFQRLPDIACLVLLFRDIQTHVQTFRHKLTQFSPAQCGFSLGSRRNRASGKSMVVFMG